MAEPSLPNLSPYDEALVHYTEWPVDEVLGRPAGQTSEAIRSFVKKIAGQSEDARLEQQFITPDRMTASSMVRHAKKIGLNEQVIESVFQAVAELELFRELGKGEYPTALTNYPPDVVQQKLADIQTALSE